MKGLFLKVVIGNKSLATMCLSQFRINEELSRVLSLKAPVGVWLPINTQPEHEDSEYRFLKCLHCYHEDFNEDGERLYDYACNECGLTISATEYIVESA